MPVPVTDVDVLKTYLRGVLGRAKHHAQNVDEIILAIAGGVISRKNSRPLEVRKAPSSGMGNVLSFVSTRGRQYALSYDHASQAIVLKQGNIQGAVLHTFTNATPISQVAAIFAGL
jgi:Integron cassette protein VCH_CASS1 chain